MTIHLKKIKYDVITETIAGELECGDQYCIMELDDSVIFAVVDGLGHGEEAAFAAKKAVHILETNTDKSIKTILELCNQALVETRGAAMTIVHLDSSNRLTYLTVGNVMGVCWKKDDYGKSSQKIFLQKPGIVGSQLPRLLQMKVINLDSDDIIILATDGINAQFENEQQTLETTGKIAQRIFNSYRNKKDDGLILVAQII